MNKIFLFAAVSFFLVGFGSQAFAQYDDKLVVLETNLGNVVIDFFRSDAPNHVDNFVGLVESGFYDGTLFHRVIPGFMIQGGDPNTVEGDPSTWGLGGPSERVNEEFNTIKHDRGIVSMARSSDPNSAGSQFFIVHEGSSSYEFSLDGKYTVFGRIVTEESFDTLDKIVSVETENNYSNTEKSLPVDHEAVRIIKAEVVNRSEISNILELPEPKHMQTAETAATDNQKFESAEHEISFSIPEGWLLQQQEKIQEDSPDVVAVGPKTGVMNPVISLTVQQTNQRTMDELISAKDEKLNQAIELGTLKIISQEKTTINGNRAYVTNAEGVFSSNDETFNVKFKEVMFYDTEKFYNLAYANGIEDFESQLPRFEDTLDSFEILSKENEVEEGGGCLIATAAFGSEMAPQVQQLRELRDNTILKTGSGMAFMTSFNQFYYSFSPAVADLEREHPLFKEVVKMTLTPMLSTLSLLNYADIDSEEEILGYGIGVILLNLGMYVVAPAIVIYKIRK